jgi:hypothetical protein
LESGGDWMADHPFDGGKGIPLPAKTYLMVF